ncbi:MAG TPA: serine hydrolase, partial [Phenylobacterium sp.]|nr:serine hydrolase [Phenylobacterium sp.]
SDVLMNAAGGLVTSPADMARWLTAQLTLEGGALDPQSLRSAHVKISDLQEPAAGAPCSGYAFGWNLCTFAGRQVFLHGGSYTGVRSWMSFSDAFGTGIAVLSNSDSMTGWLGGALTGIFYASLADSDFSPPDAEAFRADYGSRVAKLVEARRQAATAARNSDRWKGWAWSPDAAALDAFAGTFTSADDAAGFLVSRDGSRLVARLGELEQAWIPAAPDLFATDSGPLDAPQPVKFERARGGRIVALTWQGRRFRRN